MPVIESTQIEGLHRRVDGDRPTGEITRPTLTDLPGTMTSAELCAGFRRRYQGLKALEIEYVFSARSFDGDERLVPFGHKHFAFSGEKRFKVQSGGGHSYPHTYPAQAEGTHYYPYIYPHDAYCWNGELQQTFHAGGISARIEANKSTWVDRDIYLSNAGIPVGSFEDERVVCNDSRCCRSWADNLTDGSQGWEVLPRLELVDGAACHVLQSKSRVVQRFWIDPEIDFGVRFKESCHRPLLNLLRIRNVPANEWPVLYCSALRDYRLMGGCIWLPWCAESVSYVNRRSMRRLWGRPAHACVRKVLKLAVNEDVPQSRFTLQFLPGATVCDTVRKGIFKVGEGGTETKITDLKE